jgi:multiple sugar transport system ATP-binding protein
MIEKRSNGHGFPMARVVVEHLAKAFGPVPVLHDINLTIEDGEFVVLVGPSGCGKSTLLRAIAGLEPVTEGAVRIGERDVTDLPAKARDIAMVFQSYALYPHMTVAQNMGFSLRLRGDERSTIDARVKDAAAILDLSELLDRKPAALSGGQRQRVAMGRAIVRDPKVFLFDEPLSNLDAKLRVVMRSEIKALHQRLKTTTIYVTHDQVEAMTMADCIVVMRAGKIEQIGAPLDLYDRPANAFVAEFIGSPAMNMLGSLLERSGVDCAATLRGGVRIALPTDIGGKAAQAIVVGVRPEHIAIASGTDGFAARVEQVEPLGAQVQLVTDIGGAKLTVLLNERFLPPIGSMLRLSTHPQHTHVFDAATGLRLGAPSPTSRSIKS